jgi:hypothetical protein
VRLASLPVHSVLAFMPPPSLICGGDRSAMWKAHAGEKWNPHRACREAVQWR